MTNTPITPLEREIVKIEKDLYGPRRIRDPWIRRRLATKRRELLAQHEATKGDTA